AQKIVFESDRDKLNATASTGYEIYSMNLDGTGIVRLTSNSVFDGFSQAWFQAPATAAHARGTIRPRHGHTLESQSPAQRLLQGFDGVVETASRAHGRHGAVFEAIHLVQAARLVTGRHEDHVGSSFDLVGDGIVVRDLHRNLVGELLVQALEHLFVSLVAGSQR